MKSCPKCNRTFPDEGQKFCTFDGGLLIAPQTFDPNATMRATSIDLNAPAAERPTSRDLPDPNATIIENDPATVALPRNTGPTGPNTSGMTRPPATQPPAPPPPPPVPPPPPTPAARESGAITAEVPIQPAAPAPSGPLPPAVAQKKSKMPWIIAGILLFLLIGGGVLAGAFFFIVKPRLDQMAQRNVERPPANVNLSTPAPAASVEAPSPSPQEIPVQQPAGTLPFVNSKDQLDGKLAEHYLDFSFYYPQGWVKDPKSGVAGASNFVKVEKRLPKNFFEENFAVGWYTSTGTFIGDLPNYPQRVKEFNDSLAKIIENYEKVSEGPTKVNSMDGYEFRWQGLSKTDEHGDVHLWGRVIFLPTGKEGNGTGATLSMLTTSLAPDLSSVEDVGERGEAPVILRTFRFGKKQ